MERQPWFVQAFARGLEVIRVFGNDRPEMTLSEVARASGMSRATARRFLLTLVELGYVRTDGKDFSLAPKVLELGHSYLGSLSLPGVAQPHLEGLSEASGESSSLSVLDLPDIVYVARVPTSRIMTVTINIGTRFPAYATSMGRVLLAGLEGAQLQDYLESVTIEPLTPHTVASAIELRDAITAVRSQGHALVDQELEHGLRSVAAPIRNSRGTVVAAVNVSSHVNRVTKEAVRRELLPQLLETARAIETDLARVSPNAG
jgi:IclR family transcriptional regulator, pca regulon regulatory protein